MLVKSDNEYDKYYRHIKYDFNMTYISDESLKFLKNFNIKNLIKKRIRNTKYIYENIKCRKIKLFYNNYNKNIVPMALPFISKIKRDLVKNKLFEKNILVSIQSNRWNNNNIYKYKNLYKIEFGYLKNHFLITIDEKLSIKDLKYITNTLNSI